MSLIELDNVKKSFVSGQEELIVFNGVSFRVETGESVVITGESGCGKSTLLNLIGGLDNPTEGTVQSCGFPVHKAGEKALTEYRRKAIGFIFQFHYLLKEFTALENTMLPALMAGAPKKQARERALKLLGDVGLAGRLDHYPSQLSGGERQRVAIARSLINSPRVVLADEPTGNLDEKNSRMIEEILFSLVSDYNAVLLLVTHDIHLAAAGKRHFILSGRTLTEE
jgi:lipoprotein-releasing system ATP-binding protein